MDRIGASNNPSLNRPLSGAGKVKRHKTAEIKKAKPRAVDKVSKEPVDRLDTSREERIRIFLDKAEMNVYDYVEVGSMAFIGQILGSAAAFSLIGGVLPVVIGGALGAGAGYVLNRVGWDKKIGRAAAKGIDLALTPFKFAAKHVKNAFSRAMDFIKPSGKKEFGKKSEKGKSGDKKSKSLLSNRGEGGIIAEKQAAGEMEKSGKEKEFVSKLTSSLGSAAKVARGIPNILYPSIKNASAAEKAMIMETLDSLPLSTVTSTNTIKINPTLAEDMQASGLARDLIFDRPIELDKGYAAVEGFNKEVLIHELGHTRDFQSVPIPGVGKSSFEPFGEGPYVFDPHIDVQGQPPYSATNHWEDFAQTHQMYHTRPASLKSQTPEKFEAMDEMHKNSVYDKILDHSGVREVGKKLSEMIDKVPGLRESLSVAGTVLGPLSLRIGAERFKDGIKEADTGKKYSGKMELAQGIAYTTKVLSPLGLGITLTNWLMNRRIKKGKMSVDKANDIASKILATMAGPAGLTYLAATREMLKTPGGKEVQEFKYKSRKPKNLREKITEKVGVKLYDVQLKNSSRTIKSSDTGLTRDDKVFMAKVGGGAVAGGIGGTAAGFLGGGFAGAVIGGLIGGPFGAALGGLLGKVAGTLAGSYYGAKLGAKGGKLLDKQTRQKKAEIASEKIKKSIEESANRLKSTRTKLRTAT